MKGEGCVCSEKVRLSWTETYNIGGNPEGGVWCVTQDSFDSCILLPGQMSIKKEGIF